MTEKRVTCSGSEWKWQKPANMLPTHEEILFPVSPENPFPGGRRESLCVPLSDSSIWLRPIQSTVLWQSLQLCQRNGTTLKLRAVQDLYLGWSWSSVVHSYSHWALREVPSLIAIHRHGTHDAFSETGERSPPGNGKLSGGAWHRFLLQTHSLLQCSMEFTYECSGALYKQELRE